MHYHDNDRWAKLNLTNSQIDERTYVHQLKRTHSDDNSKIEILN